MDLQDYSDGSDESDLDYKPPGEEENLSEIDSDDPIEDDEDSKKSSAMNSKKSTKKRTKAKRGSQKKLKTKKIDDETIEKTKEEVDTLLNSSEEDKKRLDALWEEFQRPVPRKSMSTTTNTNENKVKLKETMKNIDKPETTKKRNFEELFETTDSSSKVTNNDDITTKTESSELKTVTVPAVKKSGGLSSILSQIGKKDKLTVLEKSKQDWDGYKKKEGIAEELVTYNKGKDGYLEKRDFLERTDLRQFELEKEMRAANRLRRN